MRTVTAPDGQRLAIHELGGSGRPTLLCHATGFHGAVWEPMAAALGDGLEPFAIDFRGHGASRIAPGASLAWELFAEDVLAAVDGLGLEPGAILGVGHSMGGGALAFAEQLRPGTFAGLWLFEPIIPPPGVFPRVDGEQQNPLAEGAARRRPTFPSAADAVANFASKPPLNRLRADALHAYVRHGFVTGEDGSVTLACRPEDESRVFSGAADRPIFDGLGDVRCPTVVAVSGEEGPSRFAAAVAEALPDGRLVPFAGLGHFGPLEAPDLIAAAVRELAAEL